METKHDSSQETGDSNFKSSDILKKSKSEPQSESVESQHLKKSKTFKSLFSRKKSTKVTENVDDKIENKYICPVGEKDVGSSKFDRFKSKKKSTTFVHGNTRLQEQLQQLEIQNRNKQQKIETLSRHVTSLEKTLEICNQKTESRNKIIKECDTLRKHLKKSQTDVENMELEIAFLQEEKEELEEEIKNLSEDYQRLQQKHLNLEKDRENYKTQYLATQARADASIRGVCDAMSDVVDQNRFLIKHGLKGKPKDFQKILKSTEDYLILQSEKNCLITQIEKKTTRIVAQEVYISDLKVELASAVNQIMKAGLNYTSDVIGDGPSYLQVLRDDYVLPLSGGGEDICKYLEKPDNDSCDTDAPSHSEGAGGTGSDGDPSKTGDTKSKFDPSRMSGKELFNHMKDQMNDKVLQPAAKMVQENVKEPAQKKAGTLKPTLAQAAFGGMPLEAALKMCCKTCCSCAQDCCGGGS